MTAKEYLRQIAVLDAKINRRQKEVEELKTLATHITTTAEGDRVQSSGSMDRMAGIVARWVDLEEEIGQMINRLVEVKHRIIGEIHQLEDARYIQLLEMRYVDMDTFEQIAVNMQYDIRWIYRLHGFALQEFAKKHLTSESHV